MKFRDRSVLFPLVLMACATEKVVPKVEDVEAAPILANGKRGGGIDKKYIDKAILGGMPKIRACYERSFTDGNLPEGRIAIDFEIGSNGAVISSRVESDTMGVPLVGTCVAEVIRTLIFPNSNGGGTVSVHYPFNFTPAVHNKVVRLENSYDHDQALALIAPGGSSITGIAKLRTPEGIEKTCAGGTVHLRPVTPYSLERAIAIYGSGDQGFRPAPSQGFPLIRFAVEPPNYAESGRVATCDSSGTFRFDRLLAGEYFIVAPITRRLGDLPQGGTLMYKIVLKSGEARRIELSH